MVLNQGWSILAFASHNLKRDLLFKIDGFMYIYNGWKRDFAKKIPQLKGIANDFIKESGSLRSRHQSNWEHWDLN